MRIRLLVPLLLVLLLINSCKNNNDESFSKIEDNVSELSDTIKNYIDPAAAPGEIKKLYQYEYKVIQYPLKNLFKLEEFLSEQGKDRWDCFDIDKLISEDKDPLLLIFCKRKPETPLKYIPKTLIGG